MATQTITSTWWTADSWAGFQTATFVVSGSGTVAIRWGFTDPPSTAGGGEIGAGAYTLRAPSSGMKLYIRTGTGSVTFWYQEGPGGAFDSTLTKSAYSGNSGADTGVTTLPRAVIGFSDAGSSTYEYAAYLTTGDSNLASTDTVDSSTAVLAQSARISGRTLRAYGLEYATSQASSVTSLSALQSLTKTTAYAEATTNSSGGVVQFDLSTIIAELQGVTSWATTSPIQLYIEDTGAAATGDDTTARLFSDSGASLVQIMLTDGSLVTPGTGVGGVP